LWGLLSRRVRGGASRQGSQWRFRWAYRWEKGVAQGRGCEGDYRPGGPAPRGGGVTANHPFYPPARQSRVARTLVHAEGAALAGIGQPNYISGGGGGGGGNSRGGKVMLGADTPRGEVAFGPAPRGLVFFFFFFKGPLVVPKTDFGCFPRQGLLSGAGPHAAKGAKGWNKKKTAGKRGGGGDGGQGGPQRGGRGGQTRRSPLWL